jgi:hypothetical protein
MPRPSNTDQINVDQTAEVISPPDDLPLSLHDDFYAIANLFEFRDADAPMLAQSVQLRHEIREIRGKMAKPDFQRVIVTSKGDYKTHPLIGQLRDAERQFRYYANDLGLTPGSQTKAPKRRMQKPTGGKSRLRSVV